MNQYRYLENICQSTSSLEYFSATIIHAGCKLNLTNSLLKTKWKLSDQKKGCSKKSDIEEIVQLIVVRRLFIEKICKCEM